MILYLKIIYVNTYIYICKKRSFSLRLIEFNYVKLIRESLLNPESITTLFLTETPLLIKLNVSFKVYLIGQ